MILRQVMDMYEVLDDPLVTGNDVALELQKSGAENVKVTTIEGKKGKTDSVKVLIKGKKGKSAGGDYPTLGIIGRLGGIGARPELTGFVSDGDGALAALAAALKLVQMKKKGDELLGDVVVTTHICPDAPTREHKPVPFMDSPINMKAMNEYEVLKEMDAILSIDTTKGNKVINHKGFAISPTIKEGYILKISDELVTIMQKVTGERPVVFPVSQQDITPYGNGLFHINSILQPAVATNVPVVGVAITTEVAVAGCDTGATHAEDIEKAGRFALEVAKVFTKNECSFYDGEEFKKIVNLYGKMNKFQTLGLS